MIIEARYYEDVSGYLLEGAVQALEDEGCTYDVVQVPGALEIPVVVRLVSDGKNVSDKPFDGYIALGCVIRGQTSHYDIVAGESARGIMDLGTKDGIAIGNGILTCETKAQAIVRADPDQKNKGADAAMAALTLSKIKQTYGSLKDKK
jgi:6,7-dimethyl-8-ribityllumazine synthase